MLPEYEALSFHGLIDEKFGHSRPLVVSALTSSGVEAFVVKTFTTNQIEERNVVVAEVVGNVLAGEFDLPVPEAALMNLSEEFLFNCPPNVQDLINSKDPRLKFCSIELKEVHPFAGTIKALKRLNKKVDLDTLWAFDNLIRNSDRNRHKPNILKNMEAAWLIDHERALDQIPIAFDDLFALENWPNRISQSHIAYPFLKEVKDKGKLFTDFEYYLENLNINILEPYFRQLESQGYSSHSSVILTYLQFVKQNSRKFVNFLRQTLS